MHGGIEMCILLFFIHSFIHLHSSKNIIHDKMYMQDNKAAYATLTVALLIIIFFCPQVYKSRGLKQEAIIISGPPAQSRRLKSS